MRPIKLRLTIEHLWGLIALVGIFVFVNTHPIRPHDFWWHMTIGGEILNSGHIPAVDVYTYTAFGQAYPSYQMFWLMDIILYGLYTLGGPALVILIHSLMITSAYAVIFWLCKQVSKSWRIAAFGVLFAAALGLNDWNVRPQGITFLLASLYMLGIYEYQNTRKWSWLVILPLGMIIWVNSHGTFVIGMVLIGNWLIQEIWNLLRSRRKQAEEYPFRKAIIPGIILVMTVLASFINPRGYGIITYVRTLTGNAVIQNLVTEWAAPTIHSLMGVIFFTGLLISAIVLIFSPKHPNITQFLTFVIFAVLGLRTSRGIVWFGLVMAPILSEKISYFVQKYRRNEVRAETQEGSRLLNAILSVAILSMAFVSLPWFKDALPFPQAKAGLISSETPIQATQVLLQEKPPREVFNAISFGSYLIWAAYPQYQVFVDSRIELFSENTWLDYLKISNAVDNWQNLLDAYGVNTLMLSPVEQSNLIQAAQQSVEWIELYRDATAIIFTRK